jgi:hypothetical protein
VIFLLHQYLIHFYSYGAFGNLYDGKKEGGKKLRKSTNELRLKLIQIYSSVCIILFPQISFYKNKQTLRVCLVQTERREGRGGEKFKNIYVWFKRGEGR